jgi:hypothetical protein
MVKGPPKGHAPYDGCNKGDVYGLLGKPESAWTEEEAIELGQELIKWFFITRKNIWVKQFFAEEKGILNSTVVNLEKQFPNFKKFTDRARQLQEARLAAMPLDKTKNGIDGNHARFILARHHKGEWEDKAVVIHAEDEKKAKDTIDLVTYLQSKNQDCPPECEESSESESDLNSANSNINNAQ